MSVSKILCAGGLATLMSTALLIAKPDASHDRAESAPRQSHVRINRPWSELKDLTESEKAKILEIREKAADQIREIHARERHEILAVLTEQQKAEVARIEAKDKETARRAHSHKGTTRPAASAEEN